MLIAPQFVGGLGAQPHTGTSSGLNFCLEVCSWFVHAVTNSMNPYVKLPYFDQKLLFP